MSIIAGITLFILGLITGMAIIWILKQKEMSLMLSHQDQLKAEFGNLSRAALDQNQKAFLTLAEDKFKSLLNSSEVQLEEKKKLIDLTLTDMKKNLEGLSRSTSELRGQMLESNKGIINLTDTTSKLRQILSSSKARGQWGERMVEDILNFIGLSEGINYKKQTQAGTDRPDFTFYLPSSKTINMDVKFPLVHYENYLSANNDADRERERKAFLGDVRKHVNDISKRTYIDPASGTLDYVLMFIPNESIYSFINQEDLELIDFSLSKKILLCSPITLYAVLSLIRQAVSNFSMEQKAGEMQKYIFTFRDQWKKFVEKLEIIGKSISTIQNHYDDLSGPRLRQLEKPLDKIKDLQLGLENSAEEIREND